MHLTCTALPHPKCHVTESRELRKKNFSTKILFTEFRSHKITVGTRKKLFLVKIHILKECAVVRLDAATINLKIDFMVDASKGVPHYRTFSKTNFD